MVRAMGSRVFLLCMGILVGCLGGEVMVRVLLSPAPPDVVPREIGQFDHQLGWSLKPSAQAISTRTGQPIEYRINSKGLRDDETSYEKPDGMFRIVVLGDSRTFGFGVPIEKHFTKLLEGYFRSVEVVNLGVSGYGVDQELLLLRTEGFRYQPDLVVAYVAHYGDSRHMYDERWGKPKPRFVLRDGHLKLTNVPVPQPAAPSILSWSGLRYRLYEHSRAYRLIREALLGVGRTDETLSSDQGSDKREAEESFTAELNRLGETIIQAMHEESRANGAEFVLVTQIGRLQQFAVQRGIASLDVSVALTNSALAVSKELMHINEAGNGVLAWELAQFLRTRQIVPSQHLPPVERATS